MADLRDLEVVSTAQAQGMARLAPLPNSGVAFKGRGRTNWMCGTCGAVVLDHTEPGAFGKGDVAVACGRCGALNKVP